MVRPPLAGVIPAGHPTLAGVWLSRQICLESFRHMSELIGALHAVAPRVLDDPQFLDRSVLVDGVTPVTSPRDLSESFALLDVEGAVLVRDTQTGFRVGLVVFSYARDCAAATRLAPRPGFYATCIPATSHGDTLSYILDALDDENGRRPTAEIFRSLVPPQYLLDDESMDFHLRCVFLRAVATGTHTTGGGAYGLCRMARDVLPARGYLCAVIAWADGGAGVLVYDDSEATEMVARWAPRLLHQFGLQMHDSSVFPFPADPAAREAPLLPRLLPPYISEEHYRCRVLLLTGLDTQHSDAAEVAYAVQHRLDLVYEQHQIEGVIIHRSEGVVMVVLGCSEDMEILLQEPPETWVLAFRQQTAWVSVFGCSVTWPGSAQDDSSSDTFEAQFTGGRDTKAFVHLRGLIMKDLVSLRDGETNLIVRCFIELCALADADVILRGSFQERSVLVTGITRSWSDLCCSLSSFGALDDLVQDDKRRMALAVFKSWHSATRLRREPADTWARLGFTDCRLAPGAEHADMLAEGARDLLLQEQNRTQIP